MAALFIIAKRRNKRWSVHPVEYYSAVKRRGAVTQATVWTNLTNVSRGSQSQEATWCDSIYGKQPEKANPQRDAESRWWAPGAGAGGEWGVTADERGIPFRGDENDLGLEVGGRTTPNVLNTTESYI